VQIGTRDSFQLAKPILDLRLTKHLPADEPVERGHEGVRFFEGKKARLGHDSCPRQEFHPAPVRGEVKGSF